jgi:hypothetical protein
MKKKAVSIIRSTGSFEVTNILLDRLVMEMKKTVKSLGPNPALQEFIAEALAVKA